MTPPAPRLLKEQEVLGGVAEVKIISPDKKFGILKRNLFLYRELRQNKNKYDLFIFYDLLTFIFLLPLIIGHKQKFIYEVLDSFPHYYSYKLSKNKILNKLIVSFLLKVEHFFAKYFVIKVIVNSYALFERFQVLGGKVILLNYSSPFEAAGFYNNPKNKNAFLYIGLFSKDKGADEVLEMSKRHPDNKFYIIGDLVCCFDKCDYPNVICEGRLAPDMLLERIKNIGENNFIWGISLIQSMNYSYAIQEANKDIDYLALGIPILGNKREATYKKIREGAGVLLMDFERVFVSSNQKKQYSDNAKHIYYKYYSSILFSKSLLDVVE